MRPSRGRRFGAGALAVLAMLLLGAGAALSTGLVIIERGGPAVDAGGVVARDTTADTTRATPHEAAGMVERIPLPALAPPADAPTAVPDSMGGHPAATPAELAELAAALVVPVAGVTRDRLVDSFADRRGDRGADPAGDRRHDAIDIPAPRGTPVVSAADGRVLALFDSEQGGLTVYAADASGRFVLLYGHLDRRAPGLREGAPLRQGETIGWVGTTGNAAPDTPHLHFAIARSADPARWWEGTPVNPYPLLRR